MEAVHVRWDDGQPGTVVQCITMAEAAHGWWSLLTHVSGLGETAALPSRPVLEA